MFCHRRTSRRFRPLVEFQLLGGRCFSSLLTNAMTRSSASISLSPGRPSGPERQRPPTQSTKFRPVDRTSAIGLAAGPVGFWLGLLGQDVVERLLGFLALG